MADLERKRKPVKKKAPKRHVRARSMARPQAKEIPKCPDHHQDMAFNAEKLVWRCSVPGCKMISHPKADIGGTKPTRLDGPFEVVKVLKPNGDTDKVYLRRDKIMVDVTDYCVFVDRTIADATELIGFTVELWFEDGVVLDHEGNQVEG